MGKNEVAKSIFKKGKRNIKKQKRREKWQKKQVEAPKRFPLDEVQKVLNL